MAFVIGVNSNGKLFIFLEVLFKGLRDAGVVSDSFITNADYINYFCYLLLIKATFNSFSLLSFIFYSFSFNSFAFF